MFVRVFDSGMFSDRCHTKNQKNLKASLHSAAVKHVADTQVRRRQREGRQNFLLLLDLPGQQCMLRVRHCRNVLIMSYICIIAFNNKQLTVLEKYYLPSGKKQTIFSGHISSWNRHINVIKFNVYSKWGLICWLMFWRWRRSTHLFAFKLLW